jgi:CRISPR-associated helicase Cas3
VLSTDTTGAAEAVARVREGLEDGDLTRTAAARELAPFLRSALPAGAGYAAEVAAAAKQLAGGAAELLPDGEILLTTRVRAGTAPAQAVVVTLADHQREVARRVSEICAAIGLEQTIARQLAIAAAHHDEGKRDPRFQAWLSAGAAVAEPLAKSVYVATRRRVQTLRLAAGWPAGKRHEIASALLVRRALPEAVLAAWLIVTHHGTNRPFPQHVPELDASAIELAADIDDVPVSVGAGEGLEIGSQLDVFERLSTLLGAWGLAYLEAILVFADREVSGSGE